MAWGMFAKAPETFQKLDKYLGWGDLSFGFTTDNFVNHKQDSDIHEKK